MPDRPRKDPERPVMKAPAFAHDKPRKKHKKKSKKRKGWARWMAEELFDVVEDIFD
ncbi:hypothetical protein [Shimia sp. SDUM112013]|uniref:hypothetical protein n=1 Tax=Shimia sp. SDUM112013 TaxID=3136160 RepID=UPI0032EF6D61